MPSPVLTLGDMSTTQAPLPGLDAALIGLASLVVVVPQILWPLAEHLNVMAHEGTHAITGSILGFGIKGVEINPIAEGGTDYRRPTLGPRRVVTAFVGYLGPSAFGLAAAKLITLGHIIAVLWLAVIFLVLLLSGVRVALQDGANAGDADTLTGITRLPRQLWALLWLAGTLGALYLGVRLLVLRA